MRNAKTYYFIINEKLIYHITSRFPKALKSAVLKYLRERNFHIKEVRKGIFLQVKLTNEELLDKGIKHEPRKS